MKFKETLEPGDDHLVFVIVEDRGERVLVVEEGDVKADMRITPLSAYLKTELVEI